MWIPNVVLGLAGIFLVVARARGVDTTLRFSLPAMPFRRPAAATETVSDRTQASGRRRGTVIVIRVPQFNLPRPNLLDLYVARAYMRMLVMCIVGILGLFY